MGSDPLTIKRPVNIYNLPNARGRSLGLSPLPSSLSSVAPPFPWPPAAEAADSGVVDRNFGGKAADFGRYPPVSTGSLGREGAAVFRQHPGRISVKSRRKTAPSGRIFPRTPEKGMRCYFVMVKLVVVDLSELVLINDELHTIFAMGKLGLEGMLGFVSCFDILATM